MCVLKKYELLEEPKNLEETFTSIGLNLEQILPISH